uniref:E3 ubiquitin-protein ligase RNF8 n=1 Tax=Cacopsylla melanoneura TaxID=428564 RepID=A0A8D8Y645_9HEMI
MPLKRYSRTFLLEKKDDSAIDFDVLAGINPTLEFLTYPGKKRILNMNLSKKIRKESTEKKSAVMSSPPEASNSVQSKNTTKSQMPNSTSIHLRPIGIPAPLPLRDVLPILPASNRTSSSFNNQQNPYYTPIPPLSTVHHPQYYPHHPQYISGTSHQPNTGTLFKNPHFELFSNPTNPPQSCQYYSIPPNGAQNMILTRSGPHSDIPDPQEKLSATEDDSLKELRHQFEVRLKHEQELFTMKTKQEWSERENKIRAQNIKVLQEIKNKHFKELQEIKAQHFKDGQEKEEKMHTEFQKTLQGALSFNGELQGKDSKNEEQQAQEAKDSKTIRELKNFALSFKLQGEDNKNEEQHAKEAKDLKTIKELEETLKTSQEHNDARVFELNTLNDFLKKRLEEKSNELQATQIAVKDELDTAKKEFQNELEATRIAAKQELDAAKKEFEEMIQLTEMLVTESKDKAWDELVHILDTELECHICTEIFIDADILSTCCHVFCHRCINTYYDINAGDWGSPQQRTCPLCRFPFVKRDIQPFPMGRSLIAKIEDKLPEETIQRRIRLKQEQR